MSAMAMDSSITQLQQLIASESPDNDVPDGRWSGTTLQNIDYYLEKGYRGDLKYRHVAWTLDALRSVFYNKFVYNNAVITISDTNSGGLCAMGGFRLNGSDDTTSTDANGNPIPVYTPKFVTFNFADPSNAYNSPIASPAASDYPPGFGTPPPPTNTGGSTSVVNLSVDETTGQIV